MATHGARLPYADDEPSNRRYAPETSREAAKSISPEGLSAAKLTVLNTFRLARRPMTDEQLVAAVRRQFPMCRLTDSSIRTRRRELQRRGLVEFTGTFGKTASGRRARRFELVRVVM